MVINNLPWTNDPQEDNARSNAAPPLGNCWNVPLLVSLEVTRPSYLFNRTARTFLGPFWLHLVSRVKLPLIAMKLISASNCCVILADDTVAHEVICEYCIQVS